MFHQPTWRTRRRSHGRTSRPWHPALALWFAHYNYSRKHMTLKETLAMASGLENHVWMIRELIEESAKF